MIRQLTSNGNSLQVLIIDNDLSTVTEYREALVARGFQVRTAVTAGEAGQQLNRYGAPHLIILADPLEDGLGADTIAQGFLQQYNNLCFIVVLNAADPIRTAHYLNNWSDDCVVKPVNPAEVAVRAERILNRIRNRQNVGQYVTEADDFLTIDFLNRKAYLYDTYVNLSQLETKLLHILMINNGNTVTKEFIMRRLWPDGQAADKRLYTSVSRLRKKLKVNSEVPNYIVLNPGIGYQFVRVAC